MHSTKSLLITGGCHVVDDTFVRKIKDHYNYNKVRKIYTHIGQENFSRCLELLINEKEYFQTNNYDIYFQLGNLMFRNSISHILPEYFKKRFITSVNSFLNSESKSDQLSIKNNRTVYMVILRKILKVIVFPFNFFYTLKMGFSAFSKIKKILDFHQYNENRIVIFTPFDSPEYLDKILIKVGKKIIFHLFGKVHNVQILDTSSVRYEKKYYKYADIYHLNNQGISLMSNFLIKKIK